MNLFVLDLDKRMAVLSPDSGGSTKLSREIKVMIREGKIILKM